MHQGQGGSTVELLTSFDAAKVLNRSPASVRLYAETGKLKVAGRTRSGLRLFTSDEVARFKAELDVQESKNRVKSAPE